MSVVLVVGGWSKDAALLFCLAPVHLFAHMRGVYQTGIIGTLARMVFLFVGSCIGFGILMVGLVIVGLAQVH
ncbi:MAG: hypothetical protein CGW95_13190 [Phenylobacterium zucineum]|nr:MAG: hypothetical protein CGW95_13190 [Phenylobacterium zucineum]